jgi:hydrogenase-4 component F
MLFILSGSIALKYRTTDIRGVRGLLKAAPWTGFAFLCGIVALIGLPPFGPFISEFIIFRAGFAMHSTAYAAIGVSLLAVIFAGMLASMNSMLYGSAAEPLEPIDPVRWPLAPVALNLVLLLAFGLTLPDRVQEFLGGVLKILGVSL